jgi:hypothetical protein
MNFPDSHANAMDVQCQKSAFVTDALRKDPRHNRWQRIDHRTPWAVTPEGRRLYVLPATSAA